jgi:hypothetical protein
VGTRKRAFAHPTRQQFILTPQPPGQSFDETVGVGLVVENVG